MGFITKTFDARKFARAIRNIPNAESSVKDFDELTPEDLNPCLLPAYIEALREDRITIANLDFDEIGDGDIDDLETVLHHSPANRMFGISEVFKEFEPSAVAKAGIFI